MAAAPAADDERWIAVCPLDALLAKRRKRFHVTVDGRYITVMSHKDVVYSMDTVCYHAGAALGLGDIEEAAGDGCISCPRHKFRLRLTDGKQAIFKYDVVDDVVGPCYLTFPDEERPKQRTHPTEVRDGTVWMFRDWPPPRQAPVGQTVVPGSAGPEPPGSMLSDRLAYHGIALEKSGELRIAYRVGVTPEQVQL
eukprot:Hpha_TRINITY_DN15133_c4_g2::TRINITY_DN15133_c4_g2_i1::g.126951::m.126951